MEDIKPKRQQRRHSSHSPEPERTGPDRAAFFLLCSIPMLAMVGFGAVDFWAIAFLAAFAFILTALWFADGWFRGSFRYSTNSLQLPLLGLFIVGILQLLPLGDSEANGLLPGPASNALSYEPFATRLFLIRLGCCIIFFAAALVFVDSRKRLKKLTSLIVAFAAAMSFFGILQRLSGVEAIYGIRQSPNAIFFGPFVNQHHFAAFVEMGFGLALGLLLNGGVKKNLRIFLLIASALMLIAAASTGSRGGMISLFGVAAFCGVFILLRRRRERASVPLVAIAAGTLLFVLLVGGTALFLGGGDSLFRAAGLQGGTGDLSSGRFDFWQAAIKIFLEHPLIGAGFDAFGMAFTKFDQWNGRFRIEQAHNDYLQILADGGISGFACLTAFIFLLFKKGLAAMRDVSDHFTNAAVLGALAGCFGILIHSFFDFPLRTHSNAYFFLLLVVIAAGRNAAPDVKSTPR